jgi:eukaryotic-like serine/threonine-protein kinase
MMSGPDPLLQRVRVATGDEYQIEREIGRGGMAAVFVARDIALDRRVAIKVMLPDLVNVAGLQDRFVIEARTAAHLDHPGIVTVYAVKQRAGLLYIVMKYIEGHTLEAVLRSQGQIDPTAVALIGSRVAEALSFAHGEGVVHRDVKPSNIMIDARGRAVVTDFGIARVLTAQSITVAGSMLGTPTHMSPEQCRGEPATAASDQYALGVTLYEMLAGRPPFTGSMFELITAHREQRPPPVSEFVAGVDPALEQTIMRMLAKVPADRWPSMADVAGRLSTHTTRHRGDENLRATLVMTGSATYETPDRGVPAADVLTPPDGGSTPVTPVSLQEPVRVREAGGGRVVLWSAAGLLALVMAVALTWTERNGARTATPPARLDSAPPAAAPPAAPVVDSATRAAAIRDSIVRDSIVRDSVIRDSSAKVASAKAAAAKAARPQRPAVITPRLRPESVSVQCARLLERASLGERLTDSERVLLRDRCQK